jgi:hypothetical protein
MLVNVFLVLIILFTFWTDLTVLLIYYKLKTYDRNVRKLRQTYEKLYSDILSSEHEN